MNNKNQHDKYLLEVLPSTVPSLGVFWSSKAPIKKNDYRSVTDITFISDIVFHMVAISTFDKGNG